MKTLSIIIPHKNNLDTLAKLIPTLLVNEGFEVIIIDDHSDSSTKESLYKSYAEHPQIKLLENTTDIFSAGKARNIGLKVATGDWITFVDADDIVLDNFLQEFQKIQNYKEDIIFFRPKIEKSLLTSSRLDKLFNKYFESPTNENLWILKLQFVAPWSKFLKRSFIEENKICFDEVKKNNDVMFSKKTAIKAKNVAVLDCSFYFYDFSSTSLTKKKDLASYYSNVDVNTRSIRYQADNFSTQELLKINPEVFYLSYRMILQGLKNYKNIKVLIETLKIFKKNNLFKLKFFNPYLAVIGYKKSRELFY